MKYPNLKPGTYVIINDYDKPCAKLVAVVLGKTYIDGQPGYACRYIHDAIARRIDAPDPTPVTAFGVRVVIRHGAGHYIIHRTGGSTATYQDGSPRAWQDTLSGHKHPLAPAEVVS